jgi:rhodanese-related sulfurtransferase
MIPFDITVDEYKELRDAGKDHILIDVRSESEHARVNMGGKSIPLQSLPAHLDELDPDAEIIVQCRMGGASSMATQFLRERGYKNVRNLQGGIEAWMRKNYPTS